MRKTSSTLVILVVLLLALGIVMLASASSVKGMASAHHDPYFFLKKQLIWLFLSALVGVMVAAFDYHGWQKLAFPLGGAGAFLLVLVLIPHIGVEVGGSRRWLRVGPLSIQPSEVAKFCTPIVMAAWIVQVARRIQEWKEGLLFPLAALGGVVLLMLLEPDLGTSVLTAAVGIVMLYAGGSRMKYLFLAGIVGLVLTIVAIWLLWDTHFIQHRIGRLLAFWWPEKYPESAYQVVQSKMSFIIGGPFGVGLGNSMQKQYYLPEAHNDFILAIIGEELGFVGTFSVLLLFAAILVCGIIVSMKAPDPFGRFVAFGIAMMITLQAAINVGVVTGCLPTKGLPLPFISYGGSSLMASVAGIAVLLNIALHNEIPQMDDHTRVIKDKKHRF